MLLHIYFNLWVCNILHLSFDDANSYALSQMFIYLKPAYKNAFAKSRASSVYVFNVIISIKFQLLFVA